MTENLPRVLPDGMGVQIDLNAWELPPVFRWLAETGGVAQGEMLKTFNCGVGMVVVCAADRADDLASMLADAGETVHRLGHVTAGEGVTYTGSLL